MKTVVNRTTLNRYRSRMTLIARLLRLVAAFAIAAFVSLPTGAWSDERTDQLFGTLQKQIARKVETQADKSLKPKERERRLSKINAAITKIRRSLFYLEVDARSIDAKIKQFEKRAQQDALDKKAEARYTDDEKATVAQLKKDIEAKKEKLEKETDQNSFVARLLKTQIARLNAKLEKIRNDALKRPPRPKPKVLVVRLTLDGSLSAAMQGRIAKVVKNTIVTRPIKRHRPWKFGNFRTRFQNPKTFDSLQDTYLWLQDAMRATLLIKREKWTKLEATAYQGQLSSIAARLKFTEQLVLFHLARFSPNSPLAKEMVKLKKEWQQRKAKEEAILARLKAIRKVQLALIKKFGCKPGTTVSSDDPACRKVNTLEIKFRKIKETEWIPALKKVQETQNKRAKKLIEHDKEIIGKANAYLKLIKSAFKVHTGLGGGESTQIYKQFLSQGELTTFIGEATKRAKVSDPRLKGQ